MQKETKFKPEFKPEDARAAILTGLTIDRNILDDFTKHRIDRLGSVVMTDPRYYHSEGVLRFWAAAHAALSLLPSQKAAAGRAGDFVYVLIDNYLKEKEAEDEL